MGELSLYNFFRPDLFYIIYIVINWSIVYLRVLDPSSDIVSYIT